MLTELDASMLSNLGNLNCLNNPLLSLNVKNGRAETQINFSNIPGLQYICANESQLAQIQGQITQYGYTNCEVNTYCSLLPGGNFYTIQGSNRYDANYNGCDASDIAVSHLRFSITDATNTDTVISNAPGTYSIAVPAGSHTLVPILENPSYFTVSPATVTVSFPTGASPFVQDFCFSSNGGHSDLEIIVMPLNAARPGFDTTYKIIYKNKATSKECSGDISNLHQGNYSFRYKLATEFRTANSPKINNRVGFTSG